MRMHLQYVVPISPGGIAAPRLLEKRNVDWTRKSKRRLNGGRPGAMNDWMPAGFDNPDRAANTGGFDVRLGASNVKALPINADREFEIPDGNYAVIIDRSYSMREQTGPLNTVLQDMARLSENAGIVFDCYPGGAPDETVRPRSATTGFTAMRIFVLTCIGLERCKPKIMTGLF